MVKKKRKKKKKVANKALNSAVRICDFKIICISENLVKRGPLTSFLGEGRIGWL